GDEDMGLKMLMERMRDGKSVSSAVELMIRERAAIEEEYGKRLLKLGRKFEPVQEIGTLRSSLDVVRVELEKSARFHLDLAAELREKLAVPLAEFKAAQTAIYKIVSSGRVNKHRKEKIATDSSLSKVRKRWEARAAEVSHLKVLGSNTPAGKEAEKLKIKLDQVRIQAEKAEQDYTAAAKSADVIADKWEETYRAACMECERLEEERFHFLSGSVWNFANHISATCYADEEV
ncbi:hypothetical protein BDK51DRAFT_2271, partial [Blyttiomyces helicus]